MYRVDDRGRVRIYKGFLGFRAVGPGSPVVAWGRSRIIAGKIIEGGERWAELRV